mmetsp:Transcript_123385/g.263088  ORF Transcript_123385/g.263088 Transcript_123385/m.263088 type:complete len:217 (+) Transcript_123385:44-694(+)
MVRGRPPPSTVSGLHRQGRSSALLLGECEPEDRGSSSTEADAAATAIQTGAAAATVIVPRKAGRWRQRGRFRQGQRPRPVLKLRGPQAFPGPGQPSIEDGAIRPRKPCGHPRRRRAIQVVLLFQIDRFRVDELPLFLLFRLVVEIRVLVDGQRWQIVSGALLVGHGRQRHAVFLRLQQHLRLADLRGRAPLEAVLRQEDARLLPLAKVPHPREPEL